MMTPEEIDAIAEATAAKIAQGILRLPDQLRDALAEMFGSRNVGYFAAPAILMGGPDAYYLQSHTRPDSIELTIKAPNGDDVWRAVLL